MVPATRAISTPLPSARSRSAPGPILRPLALLVAAVALRRSRRALLGLNEHLLRDVGLTAEAARAEAGRPAWDALDRIPWDVPAHWLR